MNGANEKKTGNQIGYVVFLFLILLLCLIPALGMLLPKQSTEAGGNETLVSAPVLRDADGHWNLQYLSQVLDYIEDHYFLRQNFITAWSVLNTACLHTSISEDVLLGQDGWLYFADTLPDYTGIEQMSRREIFSAAHNLALINEYCQNQDAQFLFTIAPNKNSLYPEYMPDLTILNQNHVRNADALSAELKRQNVPYLDLFALFRSQSETLYFARDSHWNSKGAALAADAFNQALNKKSDYFDGPFQLEQDHLGDLYNMLYPAGTDLEIDQKYRGTLSFTYDTPIRSAESHTITTTGERGTDSLLMFRDSFGNLLYPYLSDSFAHALFSRATDYRLNQIEQQQANYVAIELVERNLRYLLQNVPLMPAPRRETIPEEQILQDHTEWSIEPSDNLPGYVLITGAISESLEAIESEAPVYISWSGNVYEAFLLENNIFSLYVPEDASAGDSSIAS